MRNTRAACGRMLTYADVCWRMLAYAGTHLEVRVTLAQHASCMRTYADVCWRMLTYAGTHLKVRLTHAKHATCDCYVSIRQHTQHARRCCCGCCCCTETEIVRLCDCYGSIRQHTSAYVRMQLACMNLATAATAAMLRGLAVTVCAAVCPGMLMTCKCWCREEEEEERRHRCRRSF